MQTIRQLPLRALRFETGVLMRKVTHERKTSETNISITLDIDGRGKSSVSSGSGFFDHMLTAWSKHGRMDLQLTCDGDTEVDDHHSIEDIGITLGEAFKKAVGAGAGIARFATQFVPMDEALCRVSLDVSGRPFLVYNVEFLTERTGSFEACLLEEFLRAFAFAAGITLHVELLYGKNTHHIIEAIMKTLGKALRSATRVEAEFADDIPSTKGALFGE